MQDCIDEWVGVCDAAPGNVVGAAMGNAGKQDAGANGDAEGALSTLSSIGRDQGAHQSENEQVSFAMGVYLADTGDLEDLPDLGVAEAVGTGAADPETSGRRDCAFAKRVSSREATFNERSGRATPAG